MLTDQSWWISQFATRPPETGLPLFRPRSKVYLRKSKTIRVEFPAAFEQGLKAAGFVKPALLNRLCLAGLAAILYRYTGSREPETIVLGSPATLQMNGGRAGDVLPLLIQVAPDLPFASLLDRVAIAIDDSNQRAGFSLNELIAALGLNETQNPQPLFSTVLRVAGYHAPQSSELRNDVNVTVSTSGDCGMFELEYNANVHEAETVQRMAGHLLHFLEHAVVDSQGTIGSIEFLGCSEREQLLNQWSIGKVKPRQERCLHELVEEQAKENPEREALVFGNQTLSYAQLNSKSNQLAHYLLRLGVKRGTPVGLCLPAGESLLYGLLGILKSGATVVPLVPTFPAFRNAMGIEDSKMEVAVTTSPLRTSFGEKQPNLVCLDLVAEEIARESTDSPVTGISADDILYVLFTSGSTGRPKGVAMTHRTVVNLIHWQRERGADPAGQRTLQRTSIGFDVSFQEIFSTWAFGGSLAVAPDDVRDDVSLLPEFIARYGISRVFLPPVALDQLAAAAAIQRHSLATLKEVIVAGEQLRVSMAIRRFFHDVNCTLDNQYGPTETHVATAHSLAGASTRWPASPPIGKPVDNVRAYILDSQFHLVPAGVPGQICIGGVGPAKGYLREEETEEKFVADPFSVEPGARMYLTGDLGRFLSDGTMEFLGRVDHQVKIRGYRIELGDIEANLLKVPGIRHAAVAVHETDVLGKQLAAYVVTEHFGQPEAGAIRQFLLDRLPGHMVPSPSNIIHLENLPTTATGKIDRRALPIPVMRARAADGSGAMKGATEETIAAIWSRALGIEHVGRDDGFIELGGHSLIAIQIVSQINDLFTIALPLRHLLRGTTVAALSTEVDRLRQAKQQDVQTRAPIAELPVAVPPDTSATTAWQFQQFEMPGGKSIACLHQAETKYLYRDVFTHRTYNRGGIRYPEHGCILDVGAHIGLFTLYALEQAPKGKILAFEPCPPLFEALRLNVGTMPNVQLFPFALSDRRDTAPLTYYPNLTGMTSFYPDEAQEKNLLGGILKNLSRLGGQGASELLANSEEYLNESLRTSNFACERRTLSEVIHETNIQQIDLLKIDVQKAERAVLEGIVADDWKKIKQLAIEIHDLNGHLQFVTSLLTEKGYAVTVEQDDLHKGTVVHFVYAV